MRSRGLGRWAAMTVLAGAMIPAAGCGSYMKDRANDWNDIWEFGLTRSERPQFAMFFGITHGFTLGYTALPGCTLTGFANDHWGDHKMLDDSGGWGFVGTTTHVIASGNKEIPEGTLPSYDTNILGLGFGRNAGGTRMGWDCPLFIHYGWSGINTNYKALEGLDFICGLFGLDLREDDGQPRPVDVVRQ